MTISAEDIKFLEDNKHHHETLVKAFYLRSLSGETRSRMQEIIGKYWLQGYHTDLWCGPCVTDMVRLLYRLYDEWLAKQPKEPELVVTKATFPSHKKNHQRKR